eukprot:GSMAST32.ASY1.ANO1.2157.1 assembled CDS
MISAVCWARKSTMKAQPSVVQEPTESEMIEMRRAAELECIEVEATKKAKAAAAAMDKISNSVSTDCMVEDVLPAEFDMENYDNDEEEHDESALLSQVLGINNMTYHNDNAEDPYITLKEGNDSDTDEEEDLRLKSSDCIILAAKAEEEYSCLEVHVYEADTGNFYVHHDMALPAFPLCVEWLDCCGHNAEMGSFVAVGSFRPQVELWDLNTIGAMEPVLTLGGMEDGTVIPDSHTSAVLGLSWNASQRNLLLSASADHTVKLWDVSEGRCALTMRHHNDKVSSVRWNPVETSVLASCSFDRSAVVLDVRSHLEGLKLSLLDDAEELQWNPHNPALLLTATESGAVCCHDVRVASSSKGKDQNRSTLWTLQAHNKSITSLSLSPLIPGILATSSVDKSVKVWDISGPKPICIASKNMQIGPLYSASFNPEHPFLLSVGGDDGRLAVWETSEQTAIEKRFAGRVLDEPPFQNCHKNEKKDTNNSEMNEIDVPVLGDCMKRVGPKVKKMKKNKKKKGRR